MIGKIMHWKERLMGRLWRIIQNTSLLRSWRIYDAVEAEKEVGRSVENFQILWPAQRISLEPTGNDREFLKISKYFNDGFYSRPNIFVCEVPQAYCHIGTGLVCTPDFKAISDSQMEYRLAYNHNFKWFKPERPQRLAGSHYATINNVFTPYWLHWLFDCLPRIYSLYKAYPGQRIVLLVPDEMGRSWHDSLDSLLPPNFEIQRLPSNKWVQVDRLLLASYAAARANGHIPVEYYEFMRQTVFARFGLPPKNEPRERIYVSRALTTHCRILNEEQLIELLSRYGFKSVVLEKLDFRKQVELFHRAEVVVSPYGSSWGNLVWAGKIKIFILYPDRPPETHVFTYAKALGQEHFFLAGKESSAWSDFTVDLGEVENVLKNEMGLRPVASA
jgi:hypothetical protein